MRHRIDGVTFQVDTVQDVIDEYTLGANSSFAATPSALEVLAREVQYLRSRLTDLEEAMGETI